MWSNHRNLPASEGSTTPLLLTAYVQGDPMRVRALQLATVVALGAGLAAPVVHAQADPVTKIQQMGAAPYALFIVKDLGGGAYWNVTTSSLYVIDTVSATFVDAATAGSELMATTAENGRDLLLLINGAVLVPVGNVLTHVP
jgi:hypothetical protein